MCGLCGYVCRFALFSRVRSDPNPSRAVLKHGLNRESDCNNAEEHYTMRAAFLWEIEAGHHRCHLLFLRTVVVRFLVSAAACRVVLQDVEAAALHPELTRWCVNQRLSTFTPE